MEVRVIETAREALVNLEEYLAESAGARRFSRRSADLTDKEREVLAELAAGLTTEEAAQALAAAYDVVVVETVGVGQSETDVEELCDTIAVVVQPASGDTLQFLKAGIMEVPDVLVVTKSDLGEIARRAQRDVNAALRSLGSRETPVVTVSSIPPPTGIDELVEALDRHRARLELQVVRRRARRLAALADFTAEHGERGIRALGGRRGAEAFLAEQDPTLGSPQLLHLLEERAGVAG